MRLDQDNSIASGNWSALELISSLDFDINIDADFKNGPYSLFSLVETLDTIARGNWGGFPRDSVRPLGFRDRLAAAAA